MEIEDGKPLFNRDEIDNMDETLGFIIHAGLISYRRTYLGMTKGNAYSVPQSMIDYCIAHNLFPKRDHPNARDLELAKRIWITTLDSMIYAFRYGYPKSSDYGVQYSSKEIAEGKFQFSVIEDKGWFAYQNALDAHEAKQLRGREQFAAHFLDLWL